MCHLFVLRSLTQKALDVEDLWLFFFFSYTFIYLLIDFWLRWVFLAVLGLSLVGESRGYSSRCVASRHVGSVVVARGL